MHGCKLVTKSEDCLVLGSLSETNTSSSHIEVDIIILHERITQDDGISSDTTQVGSLPSGLTGLSSESTGELNNIVTGGHHISIITELELNIGQRVHVGTVLGDIDMIVQLTDDLGTSKNGRGSGVDNSRGTERHVQRITRHGDTIKGNLPVGLVDQGVVLEVAGIEAVINTTKDQLGSFGVGFSGQVERERVFLDLALIKQTLRER
mmetsp:Transcript_27791/g.31942  ORF Transcript_27791/g.31942 Transcript_27791/m.31942 type:complete len:207 (-) Transcript_27791:589-1209(-)